MFMSRHQLIIIWRQQMNASKNVADFKLVRGAVINLNCIHKEIKKLNSEDACYDSVQNILSSRIISKNVKIKIYKI
jgi:hypothetical protein